MPIKWSALTVAKAMEEVENLLNQAEPFLAEAEAKAWEATGIAYLPQYMDQRLHRLAYTIENRRQMREAIEGLRNAIPEGAIDAERQAGTQQAFSLELQPCHIRERDDFRETLGKIGYPTSNVGFPQDATEGEESRQESLKL